jgi:hypothetical protein
MPSARAVYRADLRSLLPDDDTLGHGLASVFGEVPRCERVAHIFASTFPAEILRCSFADGRSVELLCKYTAGKSSDSGGHRGGVAYEAMVYRCLLDPIGCSTPRYFGEHTEPGRGDHWLFVEYLGAAVRTDEAADPEAALLAAARWAGEFQRRAARAVADTSVLRLTEYTAGYYSHWARRAREFGAARTAEYPWLAHLCGRFDEIAGSFTAPDAVIHGEFTPHNVLVDGGVIRPVDWESAARAIGEIDVAGLLEGWPDPVASACVDEYRRVRWPRGAPSNAADRLDFARVYWALRWLGHSPRWREKKLAPRMAQLRSSGERLGLI